MFLISITLFNTLIIASRLDTLILCISFIQLLVLGLITFFVHNALVKIEIHCYSKGATDGTFAGFNYGYQQGYQVGCPPVKRKKSNRVV